MSRVRVSTTVDSELLAQARSLAPGATDSSMLEAALNALISTHLRAEIDAAYLAAYEERPADVPDEWGDLAGWRAAVGSS
jgi:antitoxin MazE5